MSRTREPCACGCGEKPVRWQAEYVRGHRPPKPAIERLMAKIPPDRTEDGCWLWQGHRTTDGYGQLRVGGRGTSNAMAHRISYELFVGPIPDGHHIDHLCRVPSCVNPSHLEPVTPQENTLRGHGYPAVVIRTDSCGRGHEGFEENAYVNPRTGLRRCRECRRIWERERYARSRAA